jgi:large subunit ribosomal protein L17
LNAGRKLNRTGAHRKALFRNLVTSLFEHEQVRTTDAKAKELRGVADRMVTLAKRGTLHARRRALSFIRKRSVVAKLFDEVAPRFRERPGGYTRVVKIGHRHGDAAPMSIIELTDRGDAAKAEAEKKRERRRRATEKKKEKGAGPAAAAIR